MGTMGTYMFSMQQDGPRQIASLIFKIEIKGGRHDSFIYHDTFFSSYLSQYVSTSLNYSSQVMQYIKSTLWHLHSGHYENMYLFYMMLVTTQTLAAQMILILLRWFRQRSYLPHGFLGSLNIGRLLRNMIPHYVVLSASDFQ